MLDMGWEDIEVAVEYEGDHHRTDRRQFNRDIARIDALTELGWIVVRVTAEDIPGGIMRPGVSRLVAPNVLLRAKKSPKSRPQSTLGAKGSSQAARLG